MTRSSGDQAQVTPDRDQALNVYVPFGSESHKESDIMVVQGLSFPPHRQYAAEPSFWFRTIFPLGSIKIKLTLLIPAPFVVP